MTQDQEKNIPLTVEGLTFQYHTREEPAIRDISLTLERGVVMLIAGASGCGKTTLIRCINGLAPRTYRGQLEGRIRIYGKDATDFTLARLSQNVGTVLQDPERQILGSTVLNEVAFGLENLSLPRDEIFRRVDDTLDYLDIAHLRDRETFNLSGGEKQAVALAGVLAMQPSMLLLDEPLASLDPASARDALRLFRRLANEGMSIMLVEHRVEDVLRIDPDLVLFMREGTTAYYGATDGMMDVVDYREVKLPAPIVIEKAALEPPVAFEPAVDQKKTDGDEALVRFEDVSFRYTPDSPLVIRDVNLTIGRGDVIAILGPNGAGKTTLVKHAIGLLKPTEGRVLLEGHETRDLSVAEIAHTLGYVFQSPSHMLYASTVREELAFGPKNLGYDAQDIEQGTLDALRTVNLEGVENDPPLALSFGQQKRVSIAAILAMRSRILMMDEPTAGQDYWNYMTFMRSILQMPGFDTIVFITHDLDLAISYANRVVLVNEGQILASGRPEEVLTDKGLLRRCNLVATSLLEANLTHLPTTGQLLSAERLAHAVRGGG